ncbi:MAG TPA: hypothetical protein VK596_02620 [Edaphobacter sp.]|nr:hypothetical protein [Edaphobacter sp.]
MRPFSALLALLLALPALAAAPAIRRIDGTTLPIAEADAFARSVLSKRPAFTTPDRRDRSILELCQSKAQAF